ncbi:hypothetical protein HanRHA438_Chr17g0827971 [Helianthus annuus]|nr:hypothetical protein HanHA89_Chr17g0718831 [Helianthus annuus]KAJ0633478.1 hypothetical protein HanLR1_Chr17g0677301 [Helianthus annuus]KAJ0637290.1 hypothetical protein HanOQP8_Chr17g0672111 [Helianthus annuus]KAJ0827622.1 hypothetical protein HanRHA438_Chr17g0827971 [Helianthus annuus]
MKEKKTDGLFRFGDKFGGYKEESNSNERGDTSGALWDIFRREDVKILEEYLLKHSREFRHTYCCPINKVYNPIHDQAYYLILEHNQEAKRGVWLVLNHGLLNSIWEKSFSFLLDVHIKCKILSFCQRKLEPRRRTKSCSPHQQVKK